MEETEPPLDEIVVDERHENNSLRRNGTNVLTRRQTGSSTSERYAVNNKAIPSTPSTIRIKTNKGGKNKEAIILALINLVIEIASAVVEQFVSPRMPFSLGLSCISAAISIAYLIYKIKDHKLRFQWKWPVPWYYYPSGGNDRIFGNFPEMVLLVCGIVRLITSAINYRLILLGREAPIKVSLWAPFYAICMLFYNLTKKSDRKQQGGGRDTNQRGGSGGGSGGGGGGGDTNQPGGSGGGSSDGGGGDDMNQPGGGSSGGGGGGDTNQPGGSGGGGDTNQQDGGGDTNQPAGGGGDGGGDMNRPGDGGEMPQPDNDMLPPGYSGDMPQPGQPDNDMLPPGYSGDMPLQYLSDEEGYDKEKSL